MDPFLALADLDHAIPYTHNGQQCRVVPQRMEAGARRHHTRFFYVESPVDSGTFYQIDASRLAGITGDGGTARHFSARETALMLSRIPRSTNHQAILKAISI